jgi:hypothetical protein
VITTALTAAAVTLAVLAPLAILTSVAVLTVVAGRGPTHRAGRRRSGRDAARVVPDGRSHLRLLDGATR